jgi:hypothetical protein
MTFFNFFIKKGSLFLAMFQEICLAILVTSFLLIAGLLE